MHTFSSLSYNYLFLLNNLAKSTQRFISSRNSRAVVYLHRASLLA